MAVNIDGSMGGMDAMAALPMDSMGNSPDGLLAAIMGVMMFVQGAFFLFYLLQSWGLYNINKKLWEPNAWLSWIPVLNVYSYVRAAWKPNTWILWLILGFTFWMVLFGLPWLILLIILIHNISKRTGGWVGRTFGFIFLGFIFFPLVWYQFKGNTAEAASVSSAVETSTVATPTPEVPVSAPVVENISPTTEAPTVVTPVPEVSVSASEITTPVTPVAEVVPTPPESVTSPNEGTTPSQS